MPPYLIPWVPASKSGIHLSMKAIWLCMNSEHVGRRSAVDLSLY